MPVPLWLAAAGQMAIPPALNAVGNWLGAGQQQDANLHNAKRQFQWQRSLIREMNEYNTPKNQMGRFMEAGLNPNLIYGQGSPGNWSSTPSAPSIQSADYQRVFADLGTQIQQARLMSSQADLTEQKVDESGIKQDLMRAQESVVRSNPHLNPSYIESLISIMNSTASMKRQEAEYLPINQGLSIQKVTKDITLLEQRFNLNQVDAKIKAEILESKEFQNYLNELTRKWIEDGSVDADSIRYGSLLLLNKFK